MRRNSSIACLRTEFISAASLRAAEKKFDLVGAHPVEIVGYFDQTFHEADAPKPGVRSRTEWDDLDHEFAGLGDRKALASGGAINQPRQMAFGPLYIDGSHLTEP
jgi:hypothetical protein